MLEKIINSVTSARKKLKRDISTLAFSAGLAFNVLMGTMETTQAQDYVPREFEEPVLIEKNVSAISLASDLNENKLGIAYIFDYTMETSLGYTDLLNPEYNLKIISTNNVAGLCSLAFNPQTSQPAIINGWDSFYSFDGASWHSSIPSTYLSPRSLAFNPQNNQPYIAATGGGEVLDLFLMNYDGANWNIERLTTIDPTLDVSLKFNSKSEPCISFAAHRWERYQNYYYNRNSFLSSDGLSIVDTSDAIFFGNSLAIDKKDIPHISYTDSTNKLIKYSQWDGNKWQTEVIDTSANGGTGLLLESQTDMPILAYPSNYEIKLATKVGNEWKKQIIGDYSDELPDSTIYNLSIAMINTNKLVCVYNIGSRVYLIAEKRALERKSSTRNWQMYE